MKREGNIKYVRGRRRYELVKIIRKKNKKRKKSNTFENKS